MFTHQSFGEIYSRYWERLYAFCFNMTQDHALSQHIIQDVFADLWERRAQVNVLAVEHYLFRAVKNQVLKEYRRKQFDSKLMENMFADYLTESAPMDDKEREEQLQRLLAALSPKRREILVMNKLDEMDIEEIAKKLNLSKQTVKNQLSTGLKQLKILAKG